MTDADVQFVLRQFNLHPGPGQVEPLGGAGGFSGACFWTIHEQDATWCLRRWPPEQPTPERLDWIHAVLTHVARQGFRLVPAPKMAQSGKTYVSHAGRLWELTPWLPGKADYRAYPSREKLQAAMQALAQFHRAADTLPGAEPRQGTSPGLAHRQAVLGRWQGGDLRRLESAIRPALWPELAELARRILAIFPRGAGALEPLLARAVQAEVPLQPCIRDIWHAHILFQGDQVSGLVDFGSMRVDNVAGDIARLLGSLAGDDQEAWSLGLESYQAVRPLAEHEWPLVRAFDVANVVLSGLNWLDWVFLEHRTFADRPAIVERVTEILSRLEHLAPQ